MSVSSHYNEQSAKDFLKLENKPNLSFLIYRDIPWLLQKYCLGKKALDFGCGPGLSTRYLSQLGFDVIGVDINNLMIKEAFSKPDGIPFAWIEHGKLPFKNNSFDLVLSVMVLLEMASTTLIKEVVSDITRVLKPGGIFLAVVGSEYFHNNEWYNKSPVGLNHDLSSGDVFYTYSKTTGITFKDHFYTKQDYLHILDKNELKVIECHEALGQENDNMPWILEKSLNPFTHFLCQKVTARSEA